MEKLEVMVQDLMWEKGEMVVVVVMVVGGDKKGKCSFLCDSFRQSFLLAVNMPDSKC